MRFQMILVLFNLIKCMLDIYRLHSINNEDDDVQQMSTRLICYINTEKMKPTRIIKYVEFTVPNFTNTQFQQNFRLTKQTFESLLRKIAPKLMKHNKFTAITQTMDPKQQLLAAIWILATPDSYRSVGERFNMSKSSLHYSVLTIIKVINSFSKSYITWPTRERCMINTEKFERCANLQGIIGAIDGTYIPIKAPKAFPERYINRKCHHAITLQAVCDTDLLFQDIFVGYPSSVNDRRIFINSDIHKNVTRGNIIIPDGQYIIGDKAYPNLRWCIVPFIDRGRLTSQQRDFNTKIAKSRQCIERAFALLKGRFRRLKYLDMTRTDLIPFVVLCCCILHNLCILNNDGLEIQIEEYIAEGRENVVGDDSDYDREEDHILGLCLRDSLTDD